MRLLLLLGALFVLYVLVKGLIGFVALSGSRRKRQEQLGGEMVQDPVCETYIVRSSAVLKEVNGDTVYFCSQGCAQVYDKRKAETQHP